MRSETERQHQIQSRQDLGAVGLERFPFVAEILGKLPNLIFLICKMGIIIVIPLVMWIK